MIYRERDGITTKTAVYLLRSRRDYRVEGMAAAAISQKRRTPPGGKATPWNLDGEDVDFLRDGLSTAHLNPYGL